MCGWGTELTDRLWDRLPTRPRPPRPGWRGPLRAGQESRRQEEGLPGVLHRAVGQEYRSSQEFRASAHRGRCGTASCPFQQAQGVGGLAGEECLLGGCEVVAGAFRLVRGEGGRAGQGPAAEGGRRRGRRVGGRRGQGRRHGGGGGGDRPCAVEEREEVVRVRRRLGQGEVRRAAVFGGAVAYTARAISALRKRSRPSLRVSRSGKDRSPPWGTRGRRVPCPRPPPPSPVRRRPWTAAGRGVAGQAVTGHVGQHLAVDQRSGQSAPPAQLGR
ncbi:hypothetical protein ACFQV4_24980 [Streptomyces thermocarboxydus]